ncbi:MAG TPA: GspH/FimT family pseudopilin [Burkholderiales bacterium]|jgi:type IV fimbrial biogenesis protein FimT|nr:GspH/FimT family pseudopilin [Burkholderiales bacterium]
MLKARDRERGFTLVEIAIALAVVVILLKLGAPSFADWLQNLQTRAATEAVLNGLQAARAEAVRRNTQVRFQFVSDLTASCALSATSLNWVVSVGDPSGKCNQSIDTATPGPVVQGRAAQEASPNATLAITPSGTAPPVTTVTFNALGGVVPQNADGSLPITQVDLSNPMVTGPTARPLRVVVSAGGSIRMCDPAVTAPDPRACP